MSARFAAAFAEGDPATLAEQLRRASCRESQRATLGVLYVSEPAAPALPQLVRELAEATGTTAWVGGVGLGVCAAGEEIHDRPAAALLLADLPPDEFPPVRRDRRPGRRSAATACRLDRDRRADAWRWSTAIRAAPICCARPSMPPPRAAPFWSAG